MRSVLSPIASRDLRSPDGWYVALLMVITLAGLWLRIDAGAAGGFWRDETQAILVARLPTWQEMLRFLATDDAHPPLFYAILRLWGRVFGWSDPAMLAPMILAGSATIPLTAYVADRHWGRAVSLGAACLVAVSPSLIHFSAIVRPYAILPGLVVLSVFFLIQLVEAPADTSLPRRALPYGLTCVLLLYMHNWSWVVLIAEGIVFLALHAREVPDEDAQTRRDRLLAAGLAVGVVAIAYLPWVPALLFQLRHAGYGPSQDSLLTMTVSGTAYFLNTAFSAGGFLDGITGGTALRVLQLAVTATCLLGIARAIRSGSLTVRMEGDRRGTRSVRAAPVAHVGVSLLTLPIAIVISPISDLVSTHVFELFAPSLFCAVVAGLVLTTRPARTWSAGGAGILLLAGIYLAGDLTGVQRKSTAREAAQIVARTGRPGDVVTLVPESLATPIFWYLDFPVQDVLFPRTRAGQPTPYADRWERLADDARFDEYRDSLADLRESGRRVWFITTRELLENEVEPGFDPAEGDWTVVRLRSHQVRDHLDDLFPVTCRFRTLPPALEERLTILLFSPTVPEARSEPSCRSSRRR